MNRRLRLEQGLEIHGGNHIGKFDDFDVVSLRQQRPSRLRHRFSDENFLLVGRHSSPLPVPWLFLLCGRQMTAPVTSFSRCILLRSTANRSGPPARAPALGLTRPQISWVPSSVK